MGVIGSRLRNRLYILGGTGAIREIVTATQTLPTRGNTAVAIPRVGKAQGSVWDTSSHPAALGSDWLTGSLSELPFLLATDLDVVIPGHSVYGLLLEKLPDCWWSALPHFKRPPQDASSSFPHSSWLWRASDSHTVASVCLSEVTVALPGLS